MQTFFNTIHIRIRNKPAALPCNSQHSRYLDIHLVSGIRMACANPAMVSKRWWRLCLVGFQAVQKSYFLFFPYFDLYILDYLCGKFQLLPKIQIRRHFVYSLTQSYNLCSRSLIFDGIYDDIFCIHSHATYFFVWFCLMTGLWQRNLREGSLLLPKPLTPLHFFSVISLVSPS